MIQRTVSGPRNNLRACERTPRAARDELTAPEIAVVFAMTVGPELVGALHAAADAEVMKAAAENMNLVSLIGGKSPIELFTRLLEGRTAHAIALDPLDCIATYSAGASRSIRSKP